MREEVVSKGDVVQLGPTMGVYAGLFAIVEAVTPIGIVGRVDVPGGFSPFDAKEGDFVRVGRARWNRDMRGTLADQTPDVFDLVRWMCERFGSQAQLLPTAAWWSVEIETDMRTVRTSGAASVLVFARAGLGPHRAQERTTPDVLMRSITPRRVAMDVVDRVVEQLRNLHL